MSDSVRPHTAAHQAFLVPDSPRRGRGSWDVWGEFSCDSGRPLGCVWFLSWFRPRGAQGPGPHTLQPRGPRPEERRRPSPGPHVPSAARLLSFTLILGAVFPFWRKTQDTCDPGPHRSLRVRSHLWAQSPEHRTRAAVHPSQACVTFTDGAEGLVPREDSPKGGPSCLCRKTGRIKGSAFCNLL